MSRHEADHWNPFPICAGLELSAPQGGDAEDGLWLNAELIFGSEPVASEEVSFRLGVKAGFLKLDLEGCTAVLQTLYAMLDQPATIARETREEERRHDTLEAKGTGGIAIEAGGEGVGGKASLGASAAGGRSHERTVTTTMHGTTEIRKVTARGTRSAPSWQITEPEGKHLDGRYLGQENLCQIAADKAGYSVTARFVCRKHDLALDIDPDPRWLLITRNKQKLALALIAKQLGRDDVDGEMELCRSILAARDEKG